MAVLSRGQITISNLVDGKISHTHQAWADGIVNGIGSVGFSLADSIGKKYTGFYSDFNEQASTDPTKYKWVETSNAIEQEIAYAWSQDGTDRFTTVYPGENLWSISNSILGKFQNWRDGLSLYDNPARFTSDFLPIKEGEEYWISSNYASYIFSVFLYKDTSSNAGLRLNDTNKNGASWVTLSSVGSGISSGGFKIPGGYSYMRLSTKVTNSDIVTPDLIISRKVKLEKSDKATIYTTNPQDDYDNAVPRYIGWSLKDSNSPSDYKWEPNPERKPWTAYARGVNGEGLSLMPYGENKILGTSSDFKTVSVNVWNGTAYGALNLSEIGLKVGDTVTASTYFKVPDSAPQGVSARINAIKADTSYIQLTSNQFILPGKEGRSFLTEKIPEGTVKVQFYVQRNNANGTGDSFAVQIKEDKLELANTMGIPTPWTPAPSEDPLGAIPKYVGTAALPYEDPYKYEWRLSSDWVDLNSSLSLQNKVDSDQYQNDQGTVWETISNLVTQEEYDQITQTANDLLALQQDMSNNMTNAKDAIAKLESGVTTINNLLKDTVEKWTFINNYMIAGEDGLAIGDSSTNLKILIAEDKISFMDGGTEVAYFTNQEFKINRGMIVDKLQINTHVIGRLNDAHTVVSYVGG
jgi:hypothetical protein